MRKVKIADTVIELNYPEEYVAKEYRLFKCEPEAATDVVWTVVEGGEPELPDNLEWLDLNGFRVAAANDCTYVAYAKRDYYYFNWIVYKNGARQVTYYLINSEFEGIAEYLFAFEQEAFFLYLLGQRGISVHSASIIYRDYAYVFSGPSQTGKSTHTAMWANKYQTPVLDGDVTVLRLMDETVYAYGLPWAGTSGKYLNRKVPLGGVVFLEQADVNQAYCIKGMEAFQRLYARSFTPAWNRELVRTRIEVTQRILQRIPMTYVLECLPDEAAVDEIKSKIDNYLKTERGNV